MNKTEQLSTSTQNPKIELPDKKLVGVKPTEKKEDKGKIVDIIEKGYLLSNKVLRYAKVVVAN